MALIYAPAITSYRGAITTPERWATWEPRVGDILVCTPPKCGTTWTQTMLTMLVNGSPDLPDALGVISPWVDADLGVSSQEVAWTIAATPGRRVLKTHTPADGFPVWEGVKVVAVYRHPLDIFFSLRRHVANRHVDDSHPMKAPIPEALTKFLHEPMDSENFDRDSLGSVVHHYLRTAQSGRIPDLITLHYADMIRDSRATLCYLADAAKIDADDAVISAIANASEISTMRAKAEQYAPVGGTGFWKNDAAFFATGSIGNWAKELTDADVETYRTRIAGLIPDPKARDWLEYGNGSAP